MTRAFARVRTSPKRMQSVQFGIEKREENQQMRSLKHLCMIMVFLCALPIAALAQNGGSIDGTVSDPNGAVVPGAKVTATQTMTGYSVTAETTPAGIYNFPLLPTGPYTITVKQ